MSIQKRIMLSSMFNITWPRYNNEKVLITTTTTTNNNSDHRILSDSWRMNRFTIVQRSIFILSLIVLFWIIFGVIYLSSRLIIRFLSNLKSFHFHYDSPSTSNEKICRAFVISTNQYGSFRPSPLLYRSDSLFSNTEQTTSQQSANTPPEERESPKANNSSLLEHYLKTYNPLRIDLTNANEGTVKTSIVKDASYEEAASDIDTRPIGNCYTFNCTSKRKFYHGERYARLKEPENCSATMSIADDRLSECSTRLTSITLPVVMVTDCSDSQRLHTDIIELNEDEKDE